MERPINKECATDMENKHTSSDGIQLHGDCHSPCQQHKESREAPSNSTPSSTRALQDESAVDGIQLHEDHHSLRQQHEDHTQSGQLASPGNISCQPKNTDTAFCFTRLKPPDPSIDHEQVHPQQREFAMGVQPCLQTLAYFTDRLRMSHSIHRFSHS